MGPDFEVVKVLTELLDELNINDYQINLNHRKLLDGMLEICGVSPETFRTICSSIDKLDKQSFEEIKKEMVEEKGLTVEMADRISTLVKKRGCPFEILSELKQEGSQFLENSGSVLALKDLETLFTAVEKSKCINRVVFHLSLARGLDYYTGVIFEAVYTGTAIEEIGSIAAGGRYVNLVRSFVRSNDSKESMDVPAVGVSLGIERIFSITEALEKQRRQCSSPEKMSAKLKAEYMLHKNPLKHFKRAEKSLIPLVVMVGEREVSEGVVRIRDYTANKEEVVVPRNNIVEELQRRLNIIHQ